MKNLTLKSELFVGVGKTGRCEENVKGINNLMTTKFLGFFL